MRSARRPPIRLRRHGLTLWLLPLLPAAAAGQATPGTTPLDPLLYEAIRWYTGVAGRVDDARAAELLTRAAADGDPLSVMWVARVHSTGRMGFDEDPARAREIAGGVLDRVRDLAADGEPEALFLVGTAYAEGLGVAVDAAEAARWYRRAAQRGHVLAQHNLGNVYFAGTGVPADDAMAVTWWTRAAEQGDAIPARRLGTMYEEGRGVGADLEKAVRWYREAAARGDGPAAEALVRLGHRPPAPL